MFDFSVAQTLDSQGRAKLDEGLLLIAESGIVEKLREHEANMMLNGLGQNEEIVASQIIAARQRVAWLLELENYILTRQNQLDYESEMPA